MSDLSSHKVFSVFDSKVKAFDAPILFRNAAEASRSFATVVNSSDQQQRPKYAMHPEDFTLFEIGTWSDLTGKIEMHAAKISLCTALEVKENKS